MGVCRNCKHPVRISRDGDNQTVEISLCTLHCIEKQIIDGGKIDRSDYSSRNAFNELSAEMIRFCIGDSATKEEIVVEMKISPGIVDYLIDFWLNEDIGMQPRHRTLHQHVRACGMTLVDVFVGHGRWKAKDNENNSHHMLEKNVKVADMGSDN